MEKKIVYSKDVIEFVTIAAEYCSFVESVEQVSKADFLSKSHKLLSALYLKTTLLPSVSNIFEDGNQKFVAEEDWMFVQSKIKRALGKHEIFLDVYQPLMALEDDAENVSLSEVFADIYQDLMDFVTLYRVGHEDSMNDALWECQQNFQHYWGARLLVALSAIHRVLYSGDDLNDDEPVGETTKIDTSNWIFTQRQEQWSDDE